MQERNDPAQHGRVPARTDAGDRRRPRRRAEVIGWTFRRENSYLPADFRSGTDPAGIGDLTGEINRFLDAGMDAFFTDNPDIGDQVVRTR